MNLTSRLIVSLVDRVTGPSRPLLASLQKVKSAASTLATAYNQPLASTVGGLKRMHQETRGAGTAAAAGIAAIVQQTREFNEAEFGYSFARVPDHYKGLKLDLKGLQDETAEVSALSRKVAREYGLIPREVQKARTEVEKIGVSGDTGQSMFMSALGLNMADAKMPTDTAVKFLGSMFASYADQRKELAARMGLNLEDDKQKRWFDDWWLKSTAAKSAFAAAKSQLDPGDLVAGARQYAPQWAAMGMDPAQVMGFIAHGSNYGFDAASLGTALKSWGNRLVKPTAAGLRWMHNLRMDRSKWTEGLGPADPQKAATALNSLLGGGLWDGKGGPAFRNEIKAMLTQAQADGTTGTEEFQSRLKARIAKRLGPSWAGKEDEIADAVSNATLVGTGGINIIEFIKEAKRANMPVAAMLEILEGRHVARNTPFFRYFEELVKLIGDLDQIDAMHLEGVQQARKESAAGKTTGLMGAWEDLMITAEKSGVIETLKNTLLGLSNALSSMPTWAVQALTAGLVGLAAATAAGFMLTSIVGGIRMIGTAALVAAPAVRILVGLLKTLTGLGLLQALAGGALGAAGILPKGSVVGPAVGLGAGAGGAAMGATGAGVAAGAAAGGLGARFLGAVKIGGRVVGRYLVPGIGLVYTGYSGWQGIREGWRTGSAWEGVKAFGRSMIGMGDAKADEAAAPSDARRQWNPADSFMARPPGATAGTAGAGTELGAVQTQAQAVTVAVRSAMDQVRAIVQATVAEMASAGEQMMGNMAAGIRAGAPQVGAAMSDAMGAQVRGAVRGSFSDGGYR